MSAVAGALWLCACAPKMITPVRMSQPGDETLTCAQIHQQSVDNQYAARNFLKQDKTVESANTAKVIGSALPYIGILILASGDLSNEEQIRARALIDRDDQLTFLAKQKNCDKGE